MEPFEIAPQVNAAAEFKEIAFDFGTPLDILREAISNSFDAHAKFIKLWFFKEQIKGRQVLKIIVDDDGDGMDRDALHAFFDLGNSLRQAQKQKLKDEGKLVPIGEKGHGTKVYFNSSKIEVHTSSKGKSYHAVMDDPFAALSDGRVPTAQVEVKDASANERGTQIVIYGYNNNQTELFNHDRLKDHILWFTKFGSFEKELGVMIHKDVKLSLKGLDHDQPEEILFGHMFPPESTGLEKLFDQYIDQAPDYFCKRYVRSGTLPDLPECSYHAVFYVEGNKIKQDYNKMLRRAGKKDYPSGAYTVSERYGIWLCKDFIPIERRNEPINYKGSEFTKLHAFFNCQDLRLSANRDSIGPTEGRIKRAIDEQIVKLYDEIMAGPDMNMLDYFADQAEAKKTAEKEKRDLESRLKRAEKAKVAEYKGVTLVEPYSEVGVLAIVAQLSVLEPNLFPFTIVDYDMRSGYDLIVKGDATTPIQNAKHFYVEYKHELGFAFNHTFKNLMHIVCWETRLKQDDEIEDILGSKRWMKISKPAVPGAHTRFMLDDPNGQIKIEVFVLKVYLKEKLGIEFKPRDATSVR